MVKCRVSSCDKEVTKYKGEGLCTGHYARLRRTGDLREDVPIGYRNHGHKKNITSTYRSWLMMRNRCNNPLAMDYSYYGARGVTVCERWDYYIHFLEDMGGKPTAKHTIGRIDSAKGYSPNNCRWETRLEQSRNRSYCKLSTTKAEEIRNLYRDLYPVKEISRLYGVSETTIRNVIRGKTWATAL